MASELWKSLSQIGPVLGKVSEVVGEFGGWMNVLGIGRKRSNANEPRSQPDHSGPEVIQENKAQEGELYSLLAWLSTLHVDDSDNSPCILEYRVKRAENGIFPKLVDALPHGAVRRLMQTVAVEVTTVKRKKTTGFTQHKDPKDPGKSKQTPITSEWDDKLNLKGQQLINAITWLVVNEGSDTEDKRIAAIAKKLQSLTVLENAEDKAAAAFKATNDKRKEVWQQIKDWWIKGNRDTRIHTAWAKVVLNDDVAIQRILTSQGALEIWSQIQAHEGDPAKQRPYHEALQSYIWKMVEEFQSPAIQRDRDRQRDTTKPLLKWLKRAPWTLIIWGLLGILVLLIALQHSRSLGA